MIMKPKIFRAQSTRLAESFELLTWSVALTALEKFPRKAMCNPAVFARTAWINPDVKVLKDLDSSLVSNKNFSQKISSSS